MFHRPCLLYTKRESDRITQLAATLFPTTPSSLHGKRFIDAGLKPFPWEAIEGRWTCCVPEIQSKVLLEKDWEGTCCTLAYSLAHSVAHTLARSHTLVPTFTSAYGFAYQRLFECLLTTLDPSGLDSQGVRS
jgi:hypothetical protein